MPINNGTSSFPCGRISAACAKALIEYLRKDAEIYIALPTFEIGQTYFDGTREIDIVIQATSEIPNKDAWGDYLDLVRSVINAFIHAWRAGEKEQQKKEYEKRQKERTLNMIPITEER